LSQKGAFADFLNQYMQENRSDEELTDSEDFAEDEDTRVVLRKQSSSLRNGSLK
jgi:hypothetical protein